MPLKIRHRKSLIQRKSIKSNKLNKSKRFIRDGSVQRLKIGGGRRKSKRFIRDGSVQRLKIGGRRRSKRFIRDGSVQRLKIGGRN
jgi:hypothetical protein